MLGLGGRHVEQNLHGQATAWATDWQTCNLDWTCQALRSKELFHAVQTHACLSTSYFSPAHCWLCSKAYLTCQTQVLLVMSLCIPIAMQWTGTVKGVQVT